MSARRPNAPPSGDRDMGVRGTGAAPAGAPRRPSAPRPSAPRPSSARASAPSTGARSSAHSHAPSRPASRLTGTTTSSGSRGVVGADRGPVPGSGLPRLFSVRALVLFVVGLLAFVLLFPTVRAYLAQRADNDRLVQHVAQARAENEDLTAELKRWTDEAYIAAQARTRLAFVLPGDTAFRVVDPETVPDPAEATVDVTASGPALAAEGTTTPWYATIWESVRVAGEAAVVDPLAVRPADAPTGTPTVPGTVPTKNGSP